MKILTLIMLMTFAGFAEAESWACQGGTIWDDSNDILVVAQSDGDESGLISVAGKHHDTFYGVKGFNRRWSFGLNEKSAFEYSFVVQLDGSAYYYDFTDLEQGETTKSNQDFICQQVD